MRIRFSLVILVLLLFTLVWVLAVVTGHAARREERTALVFIEHG